MNQEEMLLSQVNSSMAALRVALDNYRIICKKRPFFIFDSEAPQIKNKPLLGCKVVCNRIEIIKSIKKPDMVVVEVGTQAGIFARQLLEILDCNLYTIDVRYNLFDKDSLESYIKSGQLKTLQGKSWEMLEKFEDDTLDLIYIDAGHAYSDVSADLQVAKRKIKPGGHIICNDYAVWSPIEMIPYGVMAAVNEFVNSTDWPVEYLGLNVVGYHDIAIRRPL